MLESIFIHNLKALIVVGLLILIQAFFYIYVRFFTKGNDRLYWRSLFQNIKLPYCIYLLLILFYIGYSYIPENYLRTKTIDLSFICYKVFNILPLIIFVWVFFRFFKFLKKELKVQRKRQDGGYDDFSVLESIFKLLEVFIFIIAFLIILGILGIPMTGIFGLSAIAAAGFAYANQQMISNIFSGFAIYFDRPFSIGDWIYTIDGQIEGSVEKIGLRLTTMRAFDSRVIYVPNSVFNSSTIVNASRMQNRRILQYVGIRYKDFDKLPLILKKVKEMLAKNPGIDQNCTTLVNTINGDTNTGNKTEGFFGQSSINFMVYTFTKTTNWVRFQNFQDEVMILIGQIIKDCGAEIAYTTYTLDIDNKNHKIQKLENLN